MGLFAMFPLMIVILIIVVVFILRKGIISLKANTHIKILLGYGVVLIIVATYFFVAINPNLEALETLSPAELAALNEGEMIETSENDERTLVNYPEAYLMKEETLQVENDQVVITGDEHVARMDEWTFVITIEEAELGADTFMYALYEKPTILDFDGKEYNITEQLRFLEVDEIDNIIKLKSNVKKGVFHVNGLNRSPILAQFKRADTDWQEGGFSYNYGIVSGPTTLKVTVPKGTEVKIDEELQRFILEE